MKILYANYDLGFCVLEFLGEWNDCIENTISILKRNIVDLLIQEGINKFLVLGENVLNYHPSDDLYYEEWADETALGWIVGLNFREHIQQEMSSSGVSRYLRLYPELQEMNWRKYRPDQLLDLIQAALPAEISRM